ncbi:PAS domain S-box protein [Pseudomaricurvus alcaniphilus]|nr:PAS domain S-box protein [Pseudomaricurvus alcaniphilus]
MTMIRFLICLPLLLSSPWVTAGTRSLFKDEQGNTNWQHIANWSSGTLIILLTAAAISLFFSHRHTKRANRALEEIRDALEQRVRERTATLNESNQLLQETNSLLEGEIAQHKQTSARLRDSESYIKDILESMPLMLIGVNTDKQITQWNKLAEKATGVKNQQALGRNLWEVYPTITVSPDQIAKVLKENSPTTIKHCQRGQYYFDITIYPLREQSESGVVILVDNVTTRILAENMLIQRDKMSSIGELVTTTAHDINSPLQIMLKDLQAMQALLPATTEAPAQLDAPTIGSFHDCLTDALQGGHQALRVVNNLLEFANTHADNKRKVQIADIIEHTLDLARDVLSEPDGLKFKDIDIDRHYEPELPSIPCNASELQQVFFSLFRHAFKSLQDKQQEDFKPLIRIELSECYDAIWIKVQHNGVGLSITEQQYIFEPFFNKTTNSETVDLSTRLSFSYFIITEHHGGQLAVTSDVNVGTTFHIQLQIK